MATANSIGVRTTPDHPGRITPASKLSAADRAAHDAASYVRPFLSPVGEAALNRLASATGTDSDPIMDEAYRRVRDHRDAIREGLAAARAYADSAAA
jgi:hypothetical protein